MENTLSGHLLYDTAVIRPERQAEIALILKRIRFGQKRYETVAATLGNGIPWWWIGIAHFMEAGHFWPDQFSYHLHCGDRLTGRTINVPKGRPKANPGNGTLPPSKTNPYTWEESALDALRLTGTDKITDWSVKSILKRFELYNGTGYKSKGINSPYLWSFTNHYTKGKFVSDHKYSPTAVSKQPGTAAIMKALGI